MRHLWIIGFAALALALGPGTHGAPRLPSRPDDGLHPDAMIRVFAGPNAPHDSEHGVYGYLSLPCLDVVPSGKSRPRADVFKTLGLDETRTRDRRVEPAGKCSFLIWQVSPSYDLVCMTAAEKAEEMEAELLDPTRPVYGVRIVRRPANAGK